MLKFQPKYDIVVEGRPVATGETTMISEHLKIVELNCFEVHRRVVNVMKFLGTLHICKITTKTGALLYISMVYLHVIAIQTTLCSIAS